VLGHCGVHLLHVLALVASRWPAQQLTGKQGKERQPWQHFDFMMYFCLASARSEERLCWGKVNALCLETRPSGSLAGHHQIC